jgi:aspartate ammonia-lyase
VFEPVIAFRLLRNIQALRNACVVLRERCVDGITPNPERMRQFVEHSIGIVTALVPILGYAKCAEVAMDALHSGRGVYDLVLERGWMQRAELERALNPATMTGGTT